jgi:hypothetical protein
MWARSVNGLSTGTVAVLEISSMGDLSTWTVVDELAATVTVDINVIPLDSSILR